MEVSLDTWKTVVQTLEFAQAEDARAEVQSVSRSPAQAAGPRKLEGKLTVNGQLISQARDPVRVKTSRSRKTRPCDFLRSRCCGRSTYLLLFGPICRFGQLPRT